MEHCVAIGVSFFDTHGHHHMSDSRESQTEKTSSIENFTGDQVFLVKEVFTGTFGALAYKNRFVRTIVVDTLRYMPGEAPPNGFA